jgi:hypothetical protein
VTQDYKDRYNLYPVHAQEMSFEGAVKRFSAFPQPKDVYEYALLGLPKYFPITKEPITVEMVEPFLNSAITELEMETGMNISPVTHYHSEAYIDGMFENNYMGIRLQQWPATEITQMQLKYPHTNTLLTYQKYTIPPNWIYLQRNRVNVVAAIGSVTVSVNNEGLVAAGGIFTYITGFGRGAYQPGVVEIIYKAGFENDKLPSSIADLIKTCAALRFLVDIAPVLFPNSGTTVSVDGVSQSVQYNVPQMLTQRVSMLEKKKQELIASVKKGFGRTITKTFIGS